MPNKVRSWKQQKKIQKAKGANAIIQKAKGVHQRGQGQQPNSNEKKKKKTEVETLAEHIFSCRYDQNLYCVMIIQPQISSLKLFINKKNCFLISLSFY